MTKYKKEALCALSLLLLVPGCRNKTPKDESLRHKAIQSEVDIPVAGDAIKSFFEDDEDVQDFSLDDADIALMQEAAAHDNLMQQVDTTGDVSDFTWAEAQEAADEVFKAIYFEFDGSGIREDQKQVADFDVELAKKKIAENSDHQVTVVVDGHACHSAGTPAYNLAISERRARTVRDYLIAQGIPADNIKIVGRGDESPAIVDGQKVSGNRQEQWANRRSEVHIIHA